MAGGDTETLTRTIIFTDLVGSTALRTSLGDSAADEVRQEHDRALSEAIARNRGMLAKGLGDGVMAVFQSAADAADCAIAMQQGIAVLARKRGVELSIRVGVSAGDVALEDGDWFGTPVIEAARLEAAAEGGQILASELVRMLAGTRTEAVFEPVGPLTLKGLRAPLAACSIAWEPRSTAGPLPLPPLLAMARQFAFVGRNDEHEMLITAWEAAVDGQQQTVLVAGEAGIGKTRLASELAARAHESGAIVLAGRCDEDLGLPYQPFVEALRTFVEHAPEDLVQRCVAPYVAELVKLLPELADRMPTPARAGSDPDAERYQLFEAVASWLAALADDEPVLIVVDDLHWAAKPTLLLLRYLHDAARLQRVLVVGTYRPTDIDADHPLTELLAVLHRGPEARRVALDGLDGAAVAALLMEALGRELSVKEHALAIAIRDASAGNAFFAGEVVRSVADAGIGQFDPTMVPDSVRDVVGSRIARLPRPTRDVVVVAAVIGPQFDVSLVASVSEIPEAQVLDALDEASRMHLVEETGLDRYQFSHALVRETILADQSTSRRVRMHRKIADSIQLRFADDLDDHLVALAYHLGEVARADPASRPAALDYAQRAGEQAMVLVAPEQAAHHYEQALDLLAELPADPERRCDLLLGLGAALLWAADFSGARVAYRAAAEIARDLHDGSRLAHAAIGFRGPPRVVSNRYQATEVAFFEAALAALDESQPALRSLVHAYLTRSVPDPTSANQHCAEAVRLAHGVDDPIVVCNALFARAAVMFVPEAAREQMIVATEAVEVARASQSPELLLQALSNQMVVAHQLDDRGVAREAGAEVGGIAARLHLPFYLAFLELFEARRLIAAGELEEAEQRSAGALAISPEEGTTTAYLAQLMLIRGLQGRADELLDWSPLEVDRDGGRSAFAVHLALVLLHVQAARVPEAQEAFERLVANDFQDLTIGPTWTRQLELALLTDICARLDDGPGAQRLLPLVDPYDGLHAHASLSLYLGPFSLFVGILESVLGRYGDAIAHLDGAQAYLERVGDRALELRARAELGLALGAAGDRGAARGHGLLRAARTDAEQLGLVDIVRRVDQLLGRLES